jgi:hypothetical protein
MYQKVLLICTLLLTNTTILIFADSNEYKIEYEWQNSIAEQKKLNIRDYFLLLPSSILDCENSGFKTNVSREKIINKTDIVNGYMSFFKTSEIALFKDRKHNIDIVAIQIGKCGAGSTCNFNTIMQFDKIKKIWISREDLLPVGCTHSELYDKYIDNGKCPYFKLPEKGLKIKVLDESTADLICEFGWNGSRFMIGTQK